MKHFLSYILFITILATPLESVFAIGSVNECFGGKNNPSNVLSQNQLKAERQFIDSLYNEQSTLTNNINKKTLDREQIKANIKNVDEKKVDVGKEKLKIEKLESEIADLEVRRIESNRKIDEAIEKCGATDANLKADQAALDKAVNDAGGGTIPEKYKPISPVFGDLLGNTDQGIELAGLITNGFTFAVGIAGFLAVVMIVYYSLSYILSGDSFSGKKFSTEKIQNSLIGFLIILSSIVVLRTIDPNIVYLNLNPSKPGQDNVNKRPDEIAYTKAGQAAQDAFLGGLKNIGRGDTKTDTDATDIQSTNGGGSTPTKIPIDSSGKPTRTPKNPGTSNGTNTQKPNTPSSSKPPSVVLFCYKFRTKAGNVLQKKCISGFEGCVLDKKQMKKNPALYKFTQCLMSTKP